MKVMGEETKQQGQYLDIVTENVNNAYKDVEEASGEITEAQDK